MTVEVKHSQLHRSYRAVNSDHIISQKKANKGGTRKYYNTKKLGNKVIRKSSEQEINNNVRSKEENLEKKGPHLRKGNMGNEGIKVC